MHITGKAVMSFCIMLVGGGVVITALKWPFKTALFPMVVGIPLFILAVIDLCLNLFEKSDEKDVAIDYRLSKGPNEKLEIQRTLSIFAWIIGLFLLVLLIGFPFAVPLFVFLFLKLYGKEGWTVSIVSTVIAWGVFYALFVWLLNVPFADGWIQKGLRIAGIL